MPDDRTRDSSWWRHGHVWLVIAGPAAVVAASAVTGWIAFTQADAVVPQAAPAGDIRQAATQSRAMTPALTGRNHAATPARGAP